MTATVNPTQAGTGSPTAVKAERDPAALFATATLFILFLVPARYAVGTGGARLNTTAALGLVALLSWLIHLASRRGTSHALNPVTVLLILFSAGSIAEAGSAYSRTLTSVEASGVLRLGVETAGYVGLALLITDGIVGRGGLTRTCSALLAGGYFSAAISILQRLFHFGYVHFWNYVPGLGTTQVLTDPGSLLSGRAFGTASHPIEFSVTCACLLPLAIVHARYSERYGQRDFHRIGVALLAAGALVGVSRSGFIALVIALLFCIPRLPFRQRMNAIGLGVIVLAIIQVIAKGTLSYLRYQLSVAGSDNSSKGRTADYGPVFDLVAHHRWSGIGFGTYNPQQYRFLDNAWLGELVTGGIPGVVGLALVLLSGMYIAARAQRLATDNYISEVAHAAWVALLVLTVCAYFFDELSFPQTKALFFVMLAIAGLTHRLAQTQSNGVLMSGAVRAAPPMSARELFADGPSDGMTFAGNAVTGPASAT